MTEPFGGDLTICVDFASLPTYVALSPTLEFIDTLDVDVEWLPISGGATRLSSTKPDEPTDDPLAEYKARRQRARDEWARRELERNCERLGITVEQGARQFDSTLAGAALLYATERAVDVRACVDSLFAEAFRRGGDMEDAAHLATLIGDDAFVGWMRDQGAARFEALQQSLLDAGVFSSPAYVYRGEVFQGRQHLPLLRWYLAGANGPPPV